MDHNFKRLFLEGEYKDLAAQPDAQLLTDDGWSFDVQKSILTKENMYFSALFRNADENQNIFHIHGTAGIILDQILYYIYTKTLPLNICELLIASDFFLVDSLKLSMKRQAMNSISVENCFVIYMTALKINDEELLRISYRYVQTHFQALISNNLLNFEEITFESMKHFLNDNNLCVTGEHTVWKCIEKWVKIDPLCRLSLVPDLLQCLKTADIDDSLANEIIRSDLICKNPLYKNSIGTEDLSQSTCSSLVKLNSIIQSSLHDSDRSLNQFQCHRHPKCLYIIAEFKFPYLKLYISYDENLDLWRKLGETDHCSQVIFLTVVSLKVYIFDNKENINMVFDLHTKQWSDMLQPRIRRTSYEAVKLGNRIFIIGGTPEVSTEETTSVEFYDTDQGIWFDAMPMITPLLYFQAVSYQNKIFVLGGEERPVFQVYDADLNMWSLLTPPKYCFPVNFLEYHSKLYIIGGYFISRRMVEVFDIAKDTWNTITKLPVTLYSPHAIVFQDQLIVFGSSIKSGKDVPVSPVSWNEEEGLWKPVEKSVFLKCIERHLTDSIERDVEISAMLKELRNPAFSFKQ